VIGHARGWWQWLFLAITMPALVAISRVHRGEHHPTDILGSLLFSALWLTAATVLIRPNARRRTGWQAGLRRVARARARAAYGQLILSTMQQASHGSIM
jgi:membrane-associated phospholipid phosphatase